MRMRVVVADDEGNTYEGEVLLRATAAPVATRTTGRRPTRQTVAGVDAKPDFGLPVRPFMKRFARGLSGQARFALLLARLTDGKFGPTKTLEEIRNAWNKMKGPMGGRFNPAYSTRAKDEGWVHVEKTGSYVLRPSWTAALSKKR